MSTALFGVEVGYWPPLLLLPLLLIAVVVGKVRGRTIKKAWSGEGGNPLFPSMRIFWPGLCYFLATCAIIFGLSDIARRYVIDTVSYSFNRLYITLDKSSSMWNFDYTDRPIYCGDKTLKYQYPRIWNACRVTERIINATEAHSKKKPDGRRDEIGLLRFALYSYVGTYGTTDYDRARTWLKEFNWRDKGPDGRDYYTELHLALWDMFQVALQRNFRHAGGFVPLDERDRQRLLQVLASEGGAGNRSMRFQPPRELLPKLEALKSDLRDSVFIIVTDAHEGQFDGRLNKEGSISLIKMMQMAEFLELPIYFVSINADHALVRKLAEKTGRGPLGGIDRGAFYLLKGERNYEDMDAIVDKILDARFRTVEISESRREPYTPLIGGLVAAIFTSLGFFLSESRYGRSLTKNQGGSQ